MTGLRVAAAFLRKDFLEHASYRFGLLTGLAGVFAGMFFLVIFSDFAGEALTSRLATYNGNYLAFVVVGVGSYGLLTSSLRDLSGRIRQAQTLGTLEALLATRAPLAQLMISLPLYPMLRAVSYAAALLLLGVIAFDFPIHLGNWPYALLLLVLSVIAFGSVGLCFAALTVVFKRTEPLIAIFASLSFLLGGVFYPIEALPDALQIAARILPITATTEGIRMALMGDGAAPAIREAAISLAVFAAIAAPLAAIMLRWGVRRAMRDGSLTQY